MQDLRTGKSLDEFPILDKEIYVYVMLNDVGKIKIGITKNIQQRYQSLCGSNSQGNQIIYVYCSPATYLFTIERVLHDKFSQYRIPNTEWFYGEDLTMRMVIDEIKTIFNASNYKKLNEMRKSVG